MINMPYTILELQLAALDINEEQFKIPEILEINELINNKQAINKAVANDNGIDIIDLINSPNYNVLLNEFIEKQIIKVKDSLIKNGFNDKTAWAIIAIANGII